MLCPQCHYTRNREAWRPCQWKSELAVTGGYWRCKVCDDLLKHENTWQYVPEPSTPQSWPGAKNSAPHPRPFPYPGQCPQSAEILQHWATGINSTLFAEFVREWVKLTKNVRKTLSYYGAVRSRPGDPCHYRCPVEQVTYFDPSNSIYSAALGILAPQLDSENWNKKTRGDICESLMGYAYLVRRNMEPHAEHRKQTEQVADIIDEFSRTTYLLQADTGDNFFNWVLWIKSVAAWRKQEQHVMHMEVRAQQDPKGSLAPADSQEEAETIWWQKDIPVKAPPSEPKPAILQSGTWWRFYDRDHAHYYYYYYYYEPLGISTWYQPKNWVDLSERPQSYSHRGEPGSA